MTCDAPDVQVEALRAARHLTASTANDSLAEGFRSRVPAVRYAAIESGVYGGMVSAWDAAKSAARAPGADVGPYLKLLAIFGRADEHELVYAALRAPRLQPQAIWALGHIGTIRAVDACVAGMQHEAVARLCGEAYCWITGADLARDRLAATEVVLDAPSFEEDDLEANLVPAPEALWPLPDAAAVQQHWGRQRAEFTPNVRYIRGLPAGTETLLAIVETGPMLRRPDLILELSAKSRGRYDVEPRAFAARQRAMMAAGRMAIATQAGR
jgi:uncharacterized protein (TIGR02270 family)